MQQKLVGKKYKIQAANASECICGLGDWTEVGV